MLHCVSIVYLHATQYTARCRPALGHLGHRRTGTGQPILSAITDGLMPLRRIQSISNIRAPHVTRGSRGPGAPRPRPRPSRVARSRPHTTLVTRTMVTTHEPRAHGADTAQVAARTASPSGLARQVYKRKRDNRNLREREGKREKVTRRDRRGFLREEGIADRNVYYTPVVDELIW